MGYELHITRAAEWSESEADPITLDEWKQYIASDNEMRLDGFIEAWSPDGSVIRIEGEGLALWIAYSPEGPEGTIVPFDWRQGEISVKSPDEKIIAKMIAIARVLRARVQGDGGEYYGQDNS